jgi:hypothetical protein
VNAPTHPTENLNIETVLADCTAGWETCEKRRLQAEEYRARAHFAESLLLKAGINGPLMQEYAARYPIPTPGELPGVIDG